MRYLAWLAISALLVCQLGLAGCWFGDTINDDYVPPSESSE